MSSHPDFHTIDEEFGKHVTGQIVPDADFSRRFMPEPPCALLVLPPNLQIVKTSQEETHASLSHDCPKQEMTSL